MLHTRPRTRLRLLTSIFCLVLPALVLFWGSAFKASLYHTCRDLAHLPNAKLLTEQERPSQTQLVAASKAGVPPAPQFVNFIYAANVATPSSPLTLHAALPPHPSRPFAQNAALGFYFHHPPPSF